MLASCAAHADTAAYVVPEIDAVYTLQNRCSGLMLDVRHASLEPGDPVVQWRANGTAAQSWRVKTATGGSLELVAVNSGLALTVRDAGGKAAAIEQQPWTGAREQRWIFDAASDGWYRLSPVRSPGLALDVDDASLASGARVQVWPANGSCAQQWRLARVGSGPDARVSTITFATWNARYDNSGDMVASARKLAARADVIGFQEMHTPERRSDLRTGILCSACAYEGFVADYTHDGSSPASLPIVWNKALFTLGDKGSIKVSDRVTGIDDATGDDVAVSAKYITWVKLQDVKTERSFYVLDTHTVASIESGGRPNANNTTRVKLFAQHMDVLTRKLDELRATNLPVFVLGDFNVDYRKDAVIKDPMFPFVRLGSRGVRSSWDFTALAGIPATAETEGSSNRLIDYVFALARPEVRVLATSIGADRLGSDHFPVFLEASLTR